MAAEHSPGPWKLELDARGYPRGIYAVNDWDVPGAVGYVVRRAGIGLPSSRFGLANAHLIAAAPGLYTELVAAQEHVCSLLCPSVWKTGQRPPHHPQCVRISEVLASAIPSQERSDGP